LVRPARWIALVAAAAVLAFGAGFVLFARAVAQYLPLSGGRADGIVVLTGGELRVGAAARLLIDGRGTKLLISGVNRQTGLEDLKRVSGLTDRLFSCCVDIDYEAHSTSDNADQASAWAEANRFKRIIVVTSSYHMPRSLTELRRTMPGVELIPHPVISHRLHTKRWWTDAYTARVLLAEYVKFLPAAARYRIARLLRWDGFTLAGARAHGMFQR
jgi:uncharacterized SAM-binding protein YcdF (DUF218 family)